MGERQRGDFHCTIAWEKEEKGWGRRRRAKCLIGGHDGRVEGRRKGAREQRRRKWVMGWRSEGDGKEKRGRIEGKSRKGKSEKREKKETGKEGEGYQGMERWEGKRGNKL